MSANTLGGGGGKPILSHPSINKTFYTVAKLTEDRKHTKCPLDSKNKLNKSDIGPWVAQLRRNVYKVMRKHYPIKHLAMNI